jgi:4-amino-4-deoxy-L-arabinose transferase-like glycosyltransferase
VAALALAVTPIIVATSRNNTMDMLLVLTVLVAAWAVIHAAESGRLRWLLMGAVVVGLGFNIKMLEAFLVLPAFYLLYLIAAPVSLWRRITHLTIATVVLLTISLSWAVAVDLTPADQRPYVGSSSNNTEMDLIVGNNGLERLNGGRFDMSDEIGYPVPLRLFKLPLAGQIGWLLPLAVMGLIAASWQRRPRLPLDRRQESLVLWGTWLLTQGVFFSVAGHFHAYYMAMLAPAIAALVGVGVMAMWSDYQSPGWRGWLLPLMLAGVATLQVYILATYPDWSYWLTPVIVGLCLVTVTSLVIARLNPRLKARTYLLIVTSVGVLSLLVAPAIWAGYAVWDGTETNYPVAGPQPQQEVTSDDTAKTDTTMTDYLEANQSTTKYLAVVINARSAAPIILKAKKPVISMGDYHGQQTFDADKLADLMNGGAVRFFLVDSGSMKNLAQHPKKKRSEALAWVQENCGQVAQELLYSSTSKPTIDSGKETLLYDCGTGA